MQTRSLPAFYTRGVGSVSSELRMHVEASFFLPFTLLPYGVGWLCYGHSLRRDLKPGQDQPCIREEMPDPSLCLMLLGPIVLPGTRTSEDTVTAGCRLSFVTRPGFHETPQQRPPGKVAPHDHDQGMHSRGLPIIGCKSVERKQARVRKLIHASACVGWRQSEKV
jgi:hypothetical protein